MKNKLTPVQKAGDIWLKRDDLFSYNGIRGGKVRSCLHIATTTAPSGLGLGLDARPPAKGLITASARKSPQAQIVARVAERLGIPARLHMTDAKWTDEMHDAADHGGEIVQHRGKFQNVLEYHARQDLAQRPGWRHIPYGMRDHGTVAATRAQVANLPKAAQRLVVVLGGGMTAASILWGLRDLGWSLPVLGVQVGANPVKCLDRYAPADWRDRLTVANATTRHAYSEAVTAKIDGIELDPHYEAKVPDYLQPGDVFWIIGIRKKKNHENR